MQKLYSTQDRILLYLLKSKLEEQGIPSFIKNEDPAGQAGGRLPPVIAWPELWIIEDHFYPAAEKLVKAELSRLTQANKSWKCPECGEKLEGQFDVCWNCGHSKN